MDDKSDSRAKSDWDLPQRGWTRKSNRTLKEWMEKARGSYIMYWKASQRARRTLIWLTVPTLILSVFAGVTGLEAVWQDDGTSTGQRILRGISSVTVMVVGALANIVTFLDPKKEAEEFKAASDKYQDISGRLRKEYDRDPEMRTPHAVLMEKIIGWFNEIRETTPLLPMSVIDEYTKTNSPSHQPIHTRDNPFLPDIMIPIGNMEDWKPGKKSTDYHKEDLPPLPLSVSSSPEKNDEESKAEGLHMRSREPPLEGLQTSTSYNPEYDEEHGVSSPHGSEYEVGEVKVNLDSVLFS